jgi:hypothetical protein
MALVVRLLDSTDRERFDAGTSFHVGDGGELKIWDGSNHLIATFAPGQWVGVVEISRPAAKVEPVVSGAFGRDFTRIYFNGQAYAPVSKP